MMDALRRVFWLVFCWVFLLSFFVCVCGFFACLVGFKGVFSTTETSPAKELHINNLSSKMNLGSCGK